jgi:histidine ammonia-lyase
MTVVLEARADIDLHAVRRVAWQGENVELSRQALERIAECRRSFLALLDADPELVVYGVTTGYGEQANVRLTGEERRAQAARPPRWPDASFGKPLPRRMTRAIVLARLANFIEGHAAVRPQLAQAVAGMLAEDELPELSVRGHGDAGEIVALSRLFADLGERVGLEEKEGLALVNGSPCAAALLADAVLAGTNRLRLAHQIFALSVEALRAPLDAYAPGLEALWGDQDEAEALRTLRSLLEGANAERRAYQAPVSYRILPRVFGEAHRALSAAAQAAEISLRSVSDNPVYVPPDDEHPLGRVWSTGGYHNGQAHPALDRLAATWANLCHLAERHGERLVHEALPPADLHRTLSVLLMVQAGISEEARTVAQPTFLTRAGFAQNDVTAPSFAAWDKEQDAGGRLEASLSVLAVLASQALHESGQDPPTPLRAFLAEVRNLVPPVDGMRALGPDCERLAATFAEQIYSPAEDPQSPVQLIDAEPYA